MGKAGEKSSWPRVMGKPATVVGLQLSGYSYRLGINNVLLRKADFKIKHIILLRIRLFKIVADYSQVTNTIGI